MRGLPRTPHRRIQTAVGQPRGNCWHTCVACLLGVDPAEVPDPRRGDALRDLDDDALRAALRLPENGFYAVARPWLLQQGFDLMLFEVDGRRALQGLFLLERPLYWIAGGKNSSGVGHAMLYRNADPWWDPHPLGAGLVQHEDATVLIARPWIDESLRG